MTGSVPPVPPPAPAGGGRDPVVVAIANVICVGYFFLGQRTKGVLAAALWLALAWPTCFSASLLVGLIAAVDGYLQACEVEAGRRIGEWTFFRAHL